MAFMTEKEVDLLLSDETRSLPGKDGRMYDFTMARLYWRSFDYIVARVSTPSHVAETALQWAEGYRIDTGTALAAYVAQRHQCLAAWIGSDEPHPPGVFPLFYLQDAPAA